jgi:transcriptional regulator with XRE-family HTH domain
MKLEQIGHEIKRFRLARGLTQAQLAAAAYLSRTTLNQLENGLVKDLGIRKVQAILEQLGLVLATQSPPKPQPPDFLSLASTTASVSFKTALTDHELLRALLTGRIPANRRPHFRVLFEEAKPAVMQGVVRQVNQWTKPGRVAKNLNKIAAAIGWAGNTSKWTTND